MDWIFGAFLLVSVIHMVEEFIYPGGFMDIMKRLNPRFAPFVTLPFVIIINGLQLFLCVIALIVGKQNLAFSLSVASLLLINSLMHVMGCIRARGYAPGVVSGLVLYLPLSVYAYLLFVASGALSVGEGIASGVLGLIYQAVPLGYLGLASILRRT